jgi:hypothetical protein
MAQFGSAARMLSVLRRVTRDSRPSTDLQRPETARDTRVRSQRAPGRRPDRSGTPISPTLGGSVLCRLASGDQGGDDLGQMADDGPEPLDIIREGDRQLTLMLWRRS